MTPLAWLGLLACSSEEAEPSLAPVTSACGPALDVPAEPRPAGGPLLEFDGEVPRSVLFIVTDTFRRDALSLYGGDRPSTPCLAARSDHIVRFDNTYATGPWTAPTTASLMTGLFPENHGVLRSNTSGEEGVLDAKLERPTFGGALQSAGWATALISGNPWVSEANGFGVDFGYANDWVRDRDRRESDDLASFTRGWLSDVQEDQRFFVHLQMLDNHFHYLPRPEYEEAWIDLDDYPWEADVPGEDVVLAAWSGFTAEDQGRAIEWLRGLYDAETLAQDAEIELTLAQLEEAGRLEDTLVVILADHGESIGEEGLFGHGNSLREELVHIPFVVYNPNLRGGVVPDIVRGVDVLPTLLSAIGVEVPTGIDGVAVTPGAGPTFAYGSYFPNSDADLAELTLTYAVRGETKVVRDCVTGEDRAFDLVADPAELSPQDPAAVVGGEALVVDLDERVATLQTGRVYAACSGE